MCRWPFGFLFAGFKGVYSVYLLAQCRRYSLAWLRAKRNWVYVKLNEGDGKREGLELCVIMLRAKKKGAIKDVWVMVELIGRLEIQ